MQNKNKIGTILLLLCLISTALFINIQPAKALTNTSFGYTIVGAENEDEAGFICTQRFQTPAYSGNLTTMSFYVNDGAGDYNFSIYSDVDVHPGNLLVAGDGGSFSGEGWKTLVMPSLILNASTYYWLTSFYSSGTLRYTDAIGLQLYKSQAYGDFPATYGEETGSWVRTFSIYANYTYSSGWTHSFMGVSTEKIGSIGGVPIANIGSLGDVP